MKTSAAEELLPDSEVYRMDQAMFCSRLWHKLKMVLCQEREARKAMKDGMRRDWDGTRGSSLLRGSPSEGVHKTPL